MKFCSSCKRLIPKGKNECPFCSRGLQGVKDQVPQEDKRRGFVRVPFDDRVRFQSLSLDPRGVNLELEGKTRDVSLSGIYFEVGQSIFSKASSCLKVSNIIWMEFVLPGNKQPIKTQGEIRRIWANPLGSSGVGVMFVNIPKDARRSIDRLITSYLKGRDEI